MKEMSARPFSVCWLPYGHTSNKPTGTGQTGLITESDKTMQALHSCNSCFGHFFFHDWQQISNETAGCMYKPSQIAAIHGVGEGGGTIK